MGSPFNQSTQNFFSSTGDGSLNPDAFSEESRSMAVNANNASAKETAENMRFNYRGKDVYNNVADQAVLAPYLKSSNDKKFPYLSSKHHVGQRYNLSQNPNPRNINATTHAEDRQLAQDRMLSGAFAYGGGPGSSYFGSQFNKDAEKDAKSAVKRHEYLKNAASQGEEAFNAALSTAEVPNKNGVMIDGKMPVLANFPFKDNSSSPKNLDGSYAANPAGQSKKNLDSYLDIRDRAIAAQNLVDSNRKIGGELKEFMSSRKPFTFSTEFDPKSGM
jgi:hypothetical protein